MGSGSDKLGSVSELYFDTVLDRVVAVRQMLGTPGGRVLELVNSHFDIAWHGHVAGAVLVVPAASDKAVEDCFPINRDGFVVLA
jgi:hypothetical protein